MTYKLSQHSLNKLEGVHPLLVAVVRRAIERSEQDFSVICGVRTLEEQKDLYAQGRTRPGPIVTQTMNSKHLKQSDGYSHAVDLLPYPADWTTVGKFDAIAKAMFDAAKALGITLRWGADWDRDGKLREAKESDSPHFEIVR